MHQSELMESRIELLVDQASETGFNRYTILNLHALLSDSLLDPQACGRLRRVPVVLTEIELNVVGDDFHATPRRGG